MTNETARIPCVGGIVVHDGRILLVQRGQEPSLGLWSIPGGRLLPGEDVAVGCAREVLEETGLVVVPGAVVGRVEIDAPAGGVYVIDDLLCVVADPARAAYPVAGDDAADARWWTLADLLALDVAGGLAPSVLPALRGWGVLALLA